MAGENDAEHVTATAARAGTTPGVMRYVLGISMILVIVVFVMLFAGPFG